jgi:hypothetical protein
VKIKKSNEIYLHQTWEIYLIVAFSPSQLCIIRKDSVPLGAAEKPLPPRPVNPRELEIYRLHTIDKKNIPELPEQYNLSEVRVRGICTAVRKKILITHCVWDAGKVLSIPQYSGRMLSVSNTTIRMFTCKSVTIPKETASRTHWRETQ